MKLWVSVFLFAGTTTDAIRRRDARSGRGAHDPQVETRTEEDFKPTPVELERPDIQSFTDAVGSQLKAIDSKPPKGEPKPPNNKLAYLDPTAKSEFSSSLRSAVSDALAKFTSHEGVSLLSLGWKPAKAELSAETASGTLGKKGQVIVFWFLVVVIALALATGVCLRSRAHAEEMRWRMKAQAATETLLEATREETKAKQKVQLKRQEEAEAKSRMEALRRTLHEERAKAKEEVMRVFVEVGEAKERARAEAKEAADALAKLEARADEERQKLLEAQREAETLAKRSASATSPKMQKAENAISSALRRAATRSGRIL